MEKEIINKQVAVIGAGPGGITCAVDLKKENIDFILIDGGTPGGKINICPRIDNYPHYKKIPGPDLAMVFFQKLLDNNISIFGEYVISLTKKDNKFYVECDSTIFICDVVVIASGTQEKKLGFDKEDKLFAHGLSYCALCDGHFFKGQDVAIIGGGNAALKEAIYLSDLVKKLYIVHRRNQFRGLNNLVEELKNKTNVEIVTPYIPIKILGENHVEGLIIQNKETNELKTLQIKGLFPLIGQNPNTQFIHIDGVLDDYKNIPVDKNMMSINCNGLFACGDVLPRVIKQIYLSEYDAHQVIKGINKYFNNQ